MKTLLLGDRFEKNLHKTYILLAGFMCAVFIVLIPPFRIPDEQRHYLAASALVEGNTHCLRSQHEISSSRIELINKMGLDTSMVIPPPGFDWSRVFGYQDDTAHIPVKVVTLVCGAPLYGHTLSALGIMVGEGLGFSHLVGFYLARIFNALYGLLFFAYVIRVAPDFKRLFFLIGIFPVVLIHFSTITYDAFVVSSLLLMFAVFLRVLVYRKVNIKLIICIIPGLLAVLLKPFYYPLVLAFSTVLFFRFKHLRKKIFLVNFLFIFVLLKIFIATFITSPENYTITSIDQYSFFQETNVHIISETDRVFDSGQQIRNILSYPTYFLKVQILSFLFSLAVISRELFGYVGLEVRYYFGYIPLVVGFCIYMGMLIEGAGRVVFSKIEKIVFLLGIAASLCLLYTFLFISNTVVGSAAANGIQGKYFVPILFILGVLFLKKSNTKSSIYNVKHYYICLLILYLIYLRLVIEYLFMWYRM